MTRITLLPFHLAKSVHVLELKHCENCHGFCASRCKTHVCIWSA